MAGMSLLHPGRTLERARIRDVVLPAAVVLCLAFTGCSDDEPGTPAASGPAANSIPLRVTIGETSKLQNGQAVSIKVEPNEGSQVFGFEAHLCRAGVTFRVDADIRPSATGKCASAPLAPGTDSFLEVAASPPYVVAEGAFKVGIGSNSFEKRDGQSDTIVCGPADPCQLALKLQYPNGFGFVAYPLTFA